MTDTIKQATWGWRCKQCGEYMTKEQTHTHTHDQQPNDHTLKNHITTLLIHYIASTGPTPEPDDLPQQYAELINELTELAHDQQLKKKL